MRQNLLFQLATICTKMIFDQIHIDLFCHIRFKSLTPGFDNAELKRYDDLP